VIYEWKKIRKIAAADEKQINVTARPIFEFFIVAGGGKNHAFLFQYFLLRV